MTFHELFLCLLRRVVAIVASLGSVAPVRPDVRGASATRSPVAVSAGRKVTMRVVALTTLLTLGHPFVVHAENCWLKCHAVAMAVYDGDDENLEAATRAFEACLQQFCQA